MAGVQDDLQRTMKSIRKGAKDIRGVTALVHDQVAGFASTGEELRGKVLDAAEHVQTRLQDIEALYDVVYEEVADTALDVAASVRTFRRNPVMRVMRTMAEPLTVILRVFLSLRYRRARRGLFSRFRACVDPRARTSTWANRSSPTCTCCRRPPPSCCGPSRSTSSTATSPPIPPSRRSTRRWDGIATTGTWDRRSTTRRSNDSLRAFGLGYLCHLAADTVAHNYFVPRQLVLTASTAAVGHAYWESRVETHLGSAYARAAKDLILSDTRQADRHLAQIISPTLFSVGTNRRLFKGLVHLAGDARVPERTQGGGGAEPVVADRPWTWSGTSGLSYDYMVDLLADRGSRCRDSSIRRASSRCTWRRRCGVRCCRGERRTRPSRLLDAAEEHFGLPGTKLAFWPERIRPLPWRAPAPARERKQRRAEA